MRSLIQSRLVNLSEQRLFPATQGKTRRLWRCGCGCWGAAFAVTKGTTLPAAPWVSREVGAGETALDQRAFQGVELRVYWKGTVEFLEVLQL